MKKNKKKVEKSPQVDTGGGAYVVGNVNTDGGDFVARDQNITVGERGVFVRGNVERSTLVTGNGNLVGDVQIIFAPIYRAIEQSGLPAQDKTDLTAEVKEIEGEVAKGDEVDESFLSRRLRNLKRMAPEIGEVVLAALSGPGAVVSTVVGKIVQKVREETA